MAITRIKNSSIANRTPKYNDVLAGLPFRPVIGTATDGGNGTSVSVAFTGNNVANGTVTYTALSSPGSITATGPASPITVTGLTSGTAYTFQVKAGNSLGDSAYSGSSNSVTPVTPTAFESIASATGTGSSNTITFSSIPGTYQHLQIRFIGKDTYATTYQYAGRIRINGSTSTIYDWHYLRGNGSAASASSSIDDTSINCLQAIFPDSSTAMNNIFGVGIVDIHDYASTTKNKTVRLMGGFETNNAAGYTNYMVLGSGLFRSTSAITSISIVSQATAWTTTTQFALYGIKGA